MKGVLYFVAGALVGSAVTYKIVERRFNNLANEEIEAVRELYKQRMAKDHSENIKGEKGVAGDPKGDISTEKVVEIKSPNLEVMKNKEMVEKIVTKLNYKTGIDMAEEGTESQQIEEFVEESEDEEDYTVPVETLPDASRPYVITEDEYGELGNEEKDLIYYSDSILADEDDVITDPESVVGDALNEFNDPTLERVFVRDERSEIDYIILRSEKTYSEVYGEEEN